MNHKFSFKEKIGIGNLLVSVWCMYWCFVNCQDGYLASGFIDFCFAMIQLLFFAYNFQILDFSIEG